MVYAMKNTFFLPVDYPPIFRAHTIGLVLPGKPTGKEEKALDKLLRAHSGYEAALTNPTEMCRLAAEFCPKMKPLTPYELEIITHYTQLHLDIAQTIQLHKDVLVQIPILQDKFKQAYQVIPQIKKEFDVLLRDARLVQHPEDKNQVMAGYRQDLVDKYHEITLPLEEKIIDAHESIVAWNIMLKEYEANCRKINTDIKFLQEFYVELYQNHQRFTLSTGVLTEDFTEFTAKLNPLFDYWHQQHTVVTDFIKEFEAVQEAWNGLYEYINKTGPRGLKKIWGN